jgi:hypothetical protein
MQLPQKQGLEQASCAAQPGSTDDNRFISVRLLPSTNWQSEAKNRDFRPAARRLLDR